MLLKCTLEICIFKNSILTKALMDRAMLDRAKSAGFVGKVYGEFLYRASVDPISAFNSWWITDTENNDARQRNQCNRSRESRKLLDCEYWKAWRMKSLMSRAAEKNGGD